MHMEIRRAVAEDILPIKDLVHSLTGFYLQDKTAPLPTWFAQSISLSEFEDRLLNPEFIHFVYTHNGVVQGYISLKSGNHVYHLFVAANAQGKGIARALWQKACATTSATRYTVRSSLYAVPVYKKFGFKESGPAANKDGIAFQPLELVLNPPV